jgi:hypothetical protein
MTHLSKLIFTFSAVLLFSVSGHAFGDNAPSWLQQVARKNVPSYDKQVPAVILHNEESVSLNSDGKLVTVENYAVKILTREGRGYAVARALYLVSSGKVRDIDGWLIRGDSTKSYGKKETLDRISDPDDVYNEYRMKIINASDDADVGSIFGYTIVSEDVPLYYQTKWFPQFGLPTLTSRYTLNLPSGWKASSLTFNSKEVVPTVNGTSYTWQMQDLPFIKDEPMSPSMFNLVPWLAITYTPEDASQAGSNKIFNNWTEISQWATAMYDPQVIVNDEVAAKARELTATAKTELEKIQAIGTFVQNLQYISIDIGVGHGNGYRPRPSNLVLSRGYGDCKDKATLMRAMLKALKIDAYPVIIYSGDATFVRREWASPGQFNHCIIAVKVSDETKTPTIINDAKLGRLLIFDATDDLTPVGDLPTYLQGSLALIAAGDDGSLMEMPITPPESNALERNVKVKLAENGSVTGTIHELTKGQSSRMERTLFRKLSKGDYRKVIERWLTSGATAAKLVKFDPQDNHADASFDLNVEFSAPSYGQLMQNRLLIFKPAVVSRRRSLSLTEKDRTYPISLSANSYTETAVFELPEGFKVDEVPETLDLKTSFGNYSASYEVSEGKLTYKRTLVTNRMVVPTEKYDIVKDFFTQILNSEQSPVVLMRN